jgi:DNA-binding transcriptional LysR family regulator
LTEAGAAYLSSSRRILELVGEAERAASGEYDTPRGELTVTAPLTFGRLHVAPVVADFLARFADVRVRLVLSDRNLQLIDERIDVAVRIGRLADTALISARVGSVRRVVCVSPAYLAAHGAPQTPEDLVGHVGVTPESLPGGPPWAFKADGAGGLRQAAIRERLAVNSAEAAIDAAVAGVGLVHVLSYQAAPALRAGRLQRVLEAFEPDDMPVHLLHAAQGPLPLKTRSFLDFASAPLRASLREA